MGSDRPLGENPLSLSENDLGSKEIKHENSKEIINRTERRDRIPVLKRVEPRSQMGVGRDHISLDGDYGAWKSGSTEAACGVFWFELVCLPDQQPPLD